MSWVANVVRLGYIAKGLIYSLIGILAARLAFGLGGGRLTDPSGALRTILAQPFGTALVILIGVGILGYAAYYIFEALSDARHQGGGVRGWSQRSMTIIKAAVYGTIGVQALSVIFFNSRPHDGTERSARALIQVPLGSWLLVLIGIGVVIFGFSQLRMVWLLSFGRFGTGARSVIMVVMGTALVRAGFRQRAAEAEGYRDVLATMASIHPWVLGGVAAGLLCFGIYQLCHARYAKLLLR
jgi:hypothetical protein